MGRCTSVPESNSQHPRPAPAHSRSGVAPGLSCPSGGPPHPLRPGEIHSQGWRGRGRYEEDRPPQSVGQGLTRGRGFPRKKQECDTQLPTFTPAGQAFPRRCSEGVSTAALLGVLLKPADIARLSPGAGSARIIKNAEMFSRTDASLQQS